jgi:hypothetical protein
MKGGTREVHLSAVIAYASVVSAVTDGRHQNAPEDSPEVMAGQVEMPVSQRPFARLKSAEHVINHMPVERAHDHGMMTSVD